METKLEVKIKTYRYYIPSIGETVKNCSEFKTIKDDLEKIILDIAIDIYYSKNGNSLLWPIDIVLLDEESNVLKELSVYLDLEPVFYTSI